MIKAIIPADQIAWTDLQSDRRGRQENNSLAGNYGYCESPPTARNRDANGLNAMIDGSAASEPCAAKARYDRAKGRIVLDLTNGSTFAFPARIAQGSEEATDNQLPAVEIPRLSRSATAGEGQ